ncbi:MAG TPA: cyclophane-containing peptide 2OG-Fe(II) oxygenase YhhC [Phenylobacterium sp.]|nr:cyclophane-containing peptide 2OG-Fe(II) oxygenase YhhC [Phenylobacterium sp.]
MTVAMLAAEVRETPFAHATHPAPLAEGLCEAALAWMETAAPWRLRVASFYEQWEFHLDPDALPAELGPLLATDTVDHLTRLMFRPLGARGLRLTEVTAHKLLPGQTIRVHNDYLADGETHRLLVQLNRGWADEQGGLLMLFGSASPEDVQRMLRPTHRSAMAFAISPHSFHAVSTIRSGERYTLVYSFQAARGG